MQRWPAVACTTAMAACGGGGSSGTGGQDALSAQALQSEVDALFPYVADQPIEVNYICSRSNSRLTYHFDLDADERFTVFIETDNGRQVSFNGSYAHANGVIRLLALNNNVLPLDESSTRIVPHLGLVGEFFTPTMRCGAVAHGHDSPATAGFKAYGCPLIHRGAESDEDNAFEFDEPSSPFVQDFRGGTFRQRDVNVYRNGSPTIWRGYGIYRRRGDTFYADFGGQFPDHALLKGQFLNADGQVRVDQLEPGSGPCARR